MSSKSPTNLELIIAGVLAILVVLAVITVLAIIPTFIWYTFDDALANALNLPGLGDVAWYHVYLSTLFVRLAFWKPSQIKSS